MEGIPITLHQLKAAFFVFKSMFWGHQTTTRGVASFGLEFEGETVGGGGGVREGKKGEEAGEVPQAFNCAGVRVQAIDSPSCRSKGHDLLFYRCQKRWRDSEEGASVEVLVAERRSYNSEDVVSLVGRVVMRPFFSRVPLFQQAQHMILEVGVVAMVSQEDVQLAFRQVGPVSGVEVWLLGRGEVGGAG